MIFRAGCLGPKTSRRNAERLHRMPRKQKAAMTRRSSTVWGFMQKSVGGEPNRQGPGNTLLQEVLPPGRACPPPPQSWGTWGALGAAVSAPVPSWPAEEINHKQAPMRLKSFFLFQQNHSKCRAPLPCTCHTLLTICKDPDS